VYVRSRRPLDSFIEFMTWRSRISIGEFILSNIRGSLTGAPSTNVAAMPPGE